MTEELFRAMVDALQHPEADELRRDLFLSHVESAMDDLQPLPTEEDPPNDD